MYFCLFLHQHHQSMLLLSLLCVEVIQAFLIGNLDFGYFFHACSWHTVGFLSFVQDWKRFCCMLYPLCKMLEKVVPDSTEPSVWYKVTCRKGAFVNVQRDLGCHLLGCSVISLQLKKHITKCITKNWFTNIKFTDSMFFLQKPITCNMELACILNNCSICSWFSSKVWHQERLTLPPLTPPYITTVFRKVLI